MRGPIIHTCVYVYHYFQYIYKSNANTQVISHSLSINEVNLIGIQNKIKLNKRRTECMRLECLKQSACNITKMTRKMWIDLNQHTIKVVTGSRRTSSFPLSILWIQVCSCNVVCELLGNQFRWETGEVGVIGKHSHWAISTTDFGFGRFMLGVACFVTSIARLSWLTRDLQCLPPKASVWWFQKYFPWKLSGPRGHRSAKDTWHVYWC